MVKSIIEAYPKHKRIARDDGSAIIHIAECFGDTIQGENIVGVPSVFLRLQHCTLNCVWCDTKEVWRKGNPYSVNELIELWDKKGIIDDLANNHHLILTGGSPLRQQGPLIELICKIVSHYNIKPFIEIENECTIMPEPLLIELVDRWNNSPKLRNSGMCRKFRYKKDILEKLSSFKDSWFKFVIDNEGEWEEIVRDFIKPGIIKKEQIVLMPEGQTRDELRPRYDWLVKLCCRESVRFTDRLHITIWNKKTGV